MAENFYTILTDIGLAKMANSQITGDKINLVEMAAGDGNGAYYNPMSSDTALRKEVWRGPIGAVGADANNANWIVIETVIPSTAGGFSVREVGLFDDAGDMIAIGKYPETYKPVLDQGSSKDLYIRMIIEVSNASAVTLKVDPAVIMASRKYVDEKIALAISPVSQSLQQLQDALATHMAETVKYNVKRFGAVGDGLKDDTLAIQSAIDSANADGGGVIYFPNGIYLTNSLTLYSKIQILGEVKTNTVLKLIDLPTGALLECSGTTSEAKEYIGVRNITLKHNKSYIKSDDIKGTLIRGYDTRFCEVVDCILTECAVHGILLSNIDNNETSARSWIIDRCIFYDFEKEKTTGIFLYTEAEYVQISNCIFRNMGQAVFSSNAANARVVNNTFLKCGYVPVDRPAINIYMNSYNSGKFTIANNSINHNEGTAIVILVSTTAVARVEYGCKIIGNDILVNEGHSNPSVSLRGVRGVIMSDNKIYASSGVNPISFADYQGLIADYNIINNNILIGGSIDNTSTGVNNLISNNIENAPV